MNLRVRRVTCASDMTAMVMYVEVDVDGLGARLQDFDGGVGRGFCEIITSGLADCGNLPSCLQPTPTPTYLICRPYTYMYTYLRAGSVRCPSSWISLMDPQLLLFRRQYLQLFDPAFIAWPPKQLLRIGDVQTWIYSHFFDDSKNARLPSPRYQLRVLKTLVSKIEQSVENPEQDVGYLTVP